MADRGVGSGLEGDGPHKRELSGGKGMGKPKVQNLIWKDRIGDIDNGRVVDVDDVGVLLHAPDVSSHLAKNVNVIFIQ